MDSEHGAVAAIVAVMLGSGVLLGSGALVVDIGTLYVEFEQLQSGADAASMKVAIDCVDDSTKCTSSIQTPIAVTYASKNANDSAAAAQICINGTGCPSPWTGTATCPPQATPPAGQSVGQYVEVRTSTLTPSNSTLIPPIFAQTIMGTGYQGRTVSACARVNWGPPADVGGNALSMGFSLCDWKRITNTGLNFYGPLGNLLNSAGLFNIIGQPPPTPGVDSAIPAVLPLSAAGLPLPSCTTPVDLTVPRGFAWLGNTDGTSPDANCMIDVNVGDWPKSFLLNGLLVGSKCAARLTALRNSGLPVLVPIFDQIQPTLVTATPAYHIVGFAPFVVTGYSGLLGGALSGASSILSGNLLNAVSNVLCGVSNCVYGYFTKTLVPQSKPAIGNGSNYGATVIGRTG